MINIDRVALNPLQYVATPDGWIDPAHAPSLDEQFAFIAEQGFRYLHCAVPADLTAVQYRDKLAEYGLAAGPGYISLRWSDDPAEREETLEKARATAAANAAAGSEVTFLSMSMAKDAPRVAHAAVGHDFDEARFVGIVDYLRRAAEIAGSEGVVPAFHPHIGSWVETEAETRRVLESIDEAVLKFGPDTGHLAWAGADVPKLLSDYAGRLAGIHIKDLDTATADAARAERLGYKETVQRGLWREPGAGDADFETLFAALGDDFDGWTVIEVDKPFAPTAQASIAACGAWLRGLAQ